MQHTFWRHYLIWQSISGSFHILHSLTFRNSYSSGFSFAIRSHNQYVINHTHVYYMTHIFVWKLHTLNVVLRLWAIPFKMIWGLGHKSYGQQRTGTKTFLCENLTWFICKKIIYRWLWMSICCHHSKLYKK